MESMKSPLVYDEGMVRHFYDKILGDLSRCEVNTMYLASRNKYMSEDERVGRRSGDTSILARGIVKTADVDHYISHVHRLSAEAPYIIGRDSKPFPVTSCVIYAAINPSDALVAGREYCRSFMEAESELIQLYLSGAQSTLCNSALNRIVKSDSILYSEMQKAVSRKLWVDIDCDLETKDGLGGLEMKKLAAIEVDGAVFEPIVVETRGGFHLLVSRKTISEFNSSLAEKNPRDMKRLAVTPERIISKVCSMLEHEGLCAKEVKVNTESLVPLPGTLQGGYPVAIY